MLDARRPSRSTFGAHRGQVTGVCSRVVHILEFFTVSVTGSVCKDSKYLFYPNSVILVINPARFGQSGRINRKLMLQIGLIWPKDDSSADHRVLDQKVEEKQRRDG